MPPEMPASCSSRTAAAAASGVCSAGLATTELPAASAAAIWPVKIASGKFHGEIQAKTPRPWSEISLEPDPGMARHVLGSLAQAGRLAVHVEARGSDAHHTAEAAYKAVGRALRAVHQAPPAELP